MALPDIDNHFTTRDLQLHERLPTDSDTKGTLGMVDGSLESLIEQ